MPDELIRHAGCAEAGSDDCSRCEEIERLEAHRCPLRRDVRDGSTLRTSGQDEQEPLVRDDLPHATEHRARRAVGPVPVFEQHDHRRLLRQHREQPRERVHERGLQMLAL